MDEMRDEFEAYCERECLGTTSKDGDGDYFNPLIDMLWHCWQTSRAALCVELPTIHNLAVVSEPLMDADDVKFALEDAGVRYE